MVEHSPDKLAGPRLFQYCANRQGSEEYWWEFIARYNPLLIRCITTVWRRYGPGGLPPPDLAKDLLQDVYMDIVKHGFRLLRDFRGTTDAEAETYLAHVANNRTISFLRARRADRRKVDEISLEELVEVKGDGSLPVPAVKPARRLTEREVIKTLERCFDGPNGKRDVLIFMLYVYDGYSVAEIAGMGICELKETSIANLLGQMKRQLRLYFSGSV